ncbi:uncharacterized protein LOC101851936 [Aplysia californica]|uniref:Uncharacterized protein LOC101851936 n=1 Tax=Aplysia californica TaxID=6500 RepID=A0ABM0JJG0_APLCA|nr:uncharacterized protein LOC101851936 [Aplysia californica]
METHGTLELTNTSGSLETLNNNTVPSTVLVATGVRDENILLVNSYQRDFVDPGRWHQNTWADFILFQLVSPILVVIGTFGNVCVVLVLSKRKYASVFSTLLYGTLAALDFLVLYLALVRYFLVATIRLDFRQFSFRVCWYE